MTETAPPPGAPLTSEQRERAQEHVGLLDEVAFRYFGSLAAQDLPRLRSLGAPGLLDAVQTYDPARGVQFRTYAWWRIRGAVRNGLRHDGSCTGELAERGVVAADEHAAWLRDAGDATHETEHEASDRFSSGLHGYAAAWMLGWLFGGRADDAESILHEAWRERALRDLDTVCDDLPERDRRVIALRDRQGLTWPEVAAALEVSEATAHRYHHGAVERLAKRLRGRLGP